MEIEGEKKYHKYKDLDKMMKDKVEIGNEAVWSLSSSKQGNGVWQLRDENYETFWQSDGPIPHTITIQFQKKMRVSDIAIYLDMKTDESYTPQELKILGGIYTQNMHEIVHIELTDPDRWIVIPLQTKLENGTLPYVYTMNFQISIQQMFHSGKDTHVRLIKIFTERQGSAEKSPNLMFQEKILR